MRSDEPTLPTDAPDSAPQRPSKELADTIPASSPPEHAKTGDSLPPSEARYRFGAELGRGGMGRVVEAFDTQLGRTVALKEVLPSGSTNVVKRFQREVQITARLEHASIVPLYDAGRTSDGRPFYVMRKVGGRPLDQLIARARGLDERLALLPNVAAAIDAIAHAHRRGVIHRDIKPQNILVGDLGETVVIDWGLAKVVGEADDDAIDPIVPSAADSLQTVIGSVFGTPGFMAPEQARGEELDPRGDVFALGATLYHLLAGKPPVRGKSATEIIASTVKHEIVPITTATPGVPAELATIIAKALAPEARDRYDSAGALAEDVRAFLTGRLVAAHRYTRFQRLARFARRHRAALAVAAAASVAVAVLAWVSVARILTERDAARTARAEAELERTTAEHNAAEAKLRADQLLVAHARTLLDKSPTEAIATLKQLESSSPPVLDEARALAKAAVARGVAWGLPTLPGPTLTLALTRDGKRLVQTNRDGDLQIVDLELRRAVVTKKVGPNVRALWVDGDRQLLLVRDKQPAALFEPASGALAPIGDVELDEVVASAAGDAVAYVDAHKNVGVLDIRARTMQPLWTSGNAQSDLAFAPDGSYLAFGEKLDLERARFVAIDRTGKLLVERSGRVLAMGMSPAGKLAVSFYDEIVEVEPTRSPAFAKVDVPVDDAHAVHFFSYVADRLAMFTFRSVLYWNGKRLWRSELGDGVYLGTEASPGVLVVTTNENKLHLLGDNTHLVLPLTSRPDGPPRVATARGNSRFVATAGDALLVWDAATVLPRFVDGLSANFIDDRHVLIASVGDDWTIIDVDTGEKQALPIEPFGMPMGVDVGDDGRVLAVIEHGDPQGQPARTAVIISADRKHQDHVKVGTGPVILVPPAGIAFAGDAGRIFAKVGTAAPRELLQLDGEIRALAPVRGTQRFAALSKAGELAMLGIDGSDVKRARVDIVRDSFIVCDAHGDVLIAAGNRLLRWSSDVHELAHFVAEPAGSIVNMTSTEAGVFVALANKELYFVPSSGDMTPRRVPMTSNIVVGDHGRLLAGLSVTQQIELVDVPSLAKWTLPRLFAGMPDVNLSPDGRRLAQSVGGRLAVFQLPQPGSDYGTWLDELTNASLRSGTGAADGTLAWPWQQQP
ncbi:MAG: serine/threonine protein kinase [Kofleriaceae bacterium]|nr:serine/threonine protein kinase [Kofleriaceae bacterium]